MEKQKMVAIGATLLVVVLVLLLIVLAVKKNNISSTTQSNPNLQKASQAINGNSPVSSSNNGEAQPIGTEPRQILGVVEKLAGDSLTLKQFASVDIRYTLNKSEVASVAKLEKNPSFDQVKAEEVMKEVQALNQVDPKNANNNQVQAENAQKMQAIQKKVMDTPELQAYVQKEASWSDIQANSKIALDINQAKGNSVTIFPDDFPMGPPGSATPGN